MVAERRSQIARMLQQHGTVRVAMLSEIFDVTEETIRRDLEELEKEGILKRTYGGAISRRGTGIELPFAAREEKNRDEKVKIARAAAELLEDGDTIILDASTTALFVARQLPAAPRLTVVTNSVRVVLELAAHPNVTVIGLGGQLRERSLSFVGPQAERALAAYHVDKAFLSCKGLTPTEGMTDSNELEVELKKRMVEAAAAVIAIVDSSKLGYVAFARICPLEQIARIITDDGAEPSMVERLSEHGTPVTVAG